MNEQDKTRQDKTRQDKTSTIKDYHHDTECETKFRTVTLADFCPSLR